MLDNIAFCKKYTFVIFSCIAISLTNAETALAKKIDNTFSPATIRLVQSNEIQEVTLYNGFSINLPAILKETVAHEWAVSPRYLEILNCIRYTKEEKQEILQLSQKLGINIKNTEYLTLYREAAKWLGTRYRWAGNSSKGVDCSGLTGILIKNVFNKDLSRSSYIIADQLIEELSADHLRPGDLVFFATRRYSNKRIDHVGVYLGDRQFIHASRKGVVVSSLDDQYYTRTLKKAGRI